MHSTIHAVCGHKKGKTELKAMCDWYLKKKKKKKKKLVSRYLGHDTIHVSPAQVSRCIDASMHRYALNLSPMQFPPVMTSSQMAPVAPMNPHNSINMAAMSNHVTNQMAAASSMRSYGCLSGPQGLTRLPVNGGSMDCLEYKDNSGWPKFEVL